MIAEVDTPTERVVTRDDDPDRTETDVELAMGTPRTLWNAVSAVMSGRPFVRTIRMTMGRPSIVHWRVLQAPEDLWIAEVKSGYRRVVGPPDRCSVRQAERIANDVTVRSGGTFELSLSRPRGRGVETARVQVVVTPTWKKVV